MTTLTKQVRLTERDRYIRSIARRVRHEQFTQYKDPDGQCDCWSYELYEALKQSLVECEMVAGHFLILRDDDVAKDEMCHWWVEVGKWVVDITADQFNWIVGRDTFTPLMMVHPSHTERWRWVRSDDSKLVANHFNHLERTQCQMV